MKNEAIPRLVVTYKAKFDSLGIRGCSHSHTTDQFSAEEKLGHCRAMLDQVDKFYMEGDIERAREWLGFVKGCLWSAGIYTFKEIKSHGQ